MERERAYKVMSSSGAISLAVGILTITVGVVCGVLSIVTGARLLKRKSDIIF